MKSLHIHKKEMMMEIEELSKSKQVVEEVLADKKDVRGLNLISIGDLGIEGMHVIEEIEIHIT